MANYNSYRQVKGDQIPDGVVSDDKLDITARHCFCTKWIYGCACRCSAGCCCQWTAPTGVRRVFWEIWGAGGNGSGACSCNRCHHYAGAGGGYYNSKMITTTPGCAYTVCAAGVYRCLSRACTGCPGCTSYVNGYNLSGFCALGGWRGQAETNWSIMCFSDWSCCKAPVSWGGDFGMGNHRGQWSGPWNCHCHYMHTRPTSAPFIGAEAEQKIHVCWIRCGCWISPYGSGGQNAMTSYCGRCCGQGGTGGPGLVKITYM